MTLLIFAAVLAGSYFLVSRIVQEDYSRYAKSIVTMYADMIKNEYAEQNEPIDVENYRDAAMIGNYVCQKYDIDYAYIYKPDDHETGIEYISVSNPESTADDSDDDFLNGAFTDYQVTQSEADLLDGKTDFVNLRNNNRYGHEYEMVTTIEDTFGNICLAGVSYSYDAVYKRIIHVFTVIAVIMLSIGILTTIGIYFIIKKYASDPAKRISRGMSEFVLNGNSSDKLEGDSTYEFDMIISSFNSMTDRIDGCLTDINRLTAESERQKTEIDIAARIQKGFLPKESFGTEDYDVNALMVTAKEVGGDIYDYLPLDDRRVLVVIGDVSGKGVSAALFMTSTLMLLRQFAKMNLPPDEILYRTNEALTAKNAEMLFVTAFIAVYDSMTHTLTYSNAGHNPPYIIGDSLRMLDDVSGTLLGLFEHETYTSTTVRLSEKDTLFLYTDGVNEAVNSRGEFYGTDRLEASLKKYRGSHAEKLISYIEKSIREFTGDAERHDDITMLALAPKKTTELMLSFDINEMEKLKDAILSLDIPHSQKLSLCLSAEECFVNICSYAFEGDPPDGEKIRVTLSISDKVELRFEDGGMPFDPLENIISPDDYDPDTDIGGLGRFIAFSSVDNMKYEYRDRKNILMITDYFKEEN